MPKSVRKPGRAGKTKTAAQEKVDLYKIHKADYVTAKEPLLVEIGPARYLAIQGRGEPGGEVFRQKLGALYGVAFTIKMARKSAGRDYKVCGLEGLWWTGGGSGNWTDEPRAEWQWKLLIRVPEFLTEQDLAGAIEKLKAKGKDADAAEVRLETVAEGRCVQALHVGPYASETQTIERMKALAARHGLSFRGRHHEIYLSDPSRVAHERLRTILRHPVG